MDSLNLDPAGKFAEEIGEWQDGQTYNVQAKIRQTAPGKFEVLELTEGGESAEPGEDAGAAPSNEAAPAAGKKSMLAGTHAPIAVLMVGGKK